jgi:hypothetical protein
MTRLTSGICPNSASSAKPLRYDLWQEWEAKAEKGRPATLLEEKVDVVFLMEERHMSLHQLGSSPQPARRSPPRTVERVILPSLARNKSRSDEHRQLGWFSSFKKKAQPALGVKPTPSRILRCMSIGENALQKEIDKR